MKPKFFRYFPIVVPVFLGLLILFYILWAPNTFEGSRTIIVSRGMYFKQVVDSLQNVGIIRHRISLEIAGKILGVTRKIHVGKYLFRSGVTNKQILEALGSGRSTLALSVTIPEGLRTTTQAGVYSAELGVDSARFAELAYDSAFAHSLGIDGESLDGYLLPETYLFTWQTDERHVLRQMVHSFQNFFADSLKIRARELNMTTTQILTLASIIEGEAIFDDERPIIAGVYYNRLKKRMRLQADPTVQYILDRGPRRLFYKDLHIESPYNTYRNYGLPPGPVNNPGKASILAALYPAKHNYLYFVADGRGGHVFSRTFAEHQRAVYRYRRIMRQQRAALHLLSSP